jgi:hypothetical protein
MKMIVEAPAAFASATLPEALASAAIGNTLAETAHDIEGATAAIALAAIASRTSGSFWSTRQRVSGAITTFPSETPGAQSGAWDAMDSAPGGAEAQAVSAKASDTGTI